MTITREEYCLKYSSSSSPERNDLADHTRKNIPRSTMLIGELEGAFFQFLIKSTAVKSVLEIGTYTGYSALTLAEALPDDGKILTLDINAETTKLAQSFWDKSPVGYKIESYVGDSQKKLQAMIRTGQHFDAIFVDADKENYPYYVSAAKKLLTNGGILIIDNVLWDNKVLDSSINDAETVAIKKACELILEEESSWDYVMLPVRDGVMLARLKV